MNLLLLLRNAQRYRGANRARPTSLELGHCIIGSKPAKGPTLAGVQAAGGRALSSLCLDGDEWSPAF